MPIRLWTGLPGSGKSAQMIAEVLNFKADHPDRPVFAINLDSLSEDVAKPITLEQLHRWWEVFPPNSLILIDECNEPDFFPLDRGVPDEWISRLVKNRREGMDFWLTTVHPTLFSAYVRRLVDLHTHCVRKFNTTVVQRYTWGRCMEACEKGGAQKAAVVTVGTLPSHVFALYKSANAHNMKRRIPKKVYLLVLCVVVAAGAAVAVPIVLRRAHEKNVEAISGKKADAAPDALKHTDDTLRQKDYVKWTEPRVPGMPWTAPAFDGQTVKAEPRVYCIAWEDGKTKCITEQGTVLNVPPKIARIIARDGVYNPFQAPSSVAYREREETGQASVQPQARPPGPSRPDQHYASNAGHLQGGIPQVYASPGDLAPLPITDGHVKMN